MFIFTKNSLTRHIFYKWLYSRKYFMDFCSVPEIYIKFI